MTEDDNFENPHQNVSFASNGGQAHGYLATPRSGSGAGVVLIQEWWGLDDHIVDVADRLGRARASSSWRPTCSAGAPPTTATRPVT